MLGVPEDPLAVGTALPASADLNSYTTPGNYTADSTVIASITHAPTTTAEYKLTVEQISDEVIKQTVTTTEAPANVYQRTGDSSSTDWVFGDWAKEIKSTDYARQSVPGITQFSSTFGFYVDNNYPEYARVYTALDSNIKTADNTNDCRHRPITPYNQHKSVFYGLAKVAGQDMSTSNNPVGTYTDEAKSAIKNMIGVEDLDVQINGTSVVEDGVANIPKATNGNFGVTKFNGDYGISANSSWDTPRINKASAALIKGGEQTYVPIVPANQHESAFYGLAKAAGADMKNSSNAVGTYTDEAKTAINKMIGSYGLNSGEAIPTNADLNTYTTPGTYSADSTVIASITNAPTITDTYKLVVETVSETVIEQIVTAANGKVYRRTGDSSSTSWTFSSWKKDISSADVASPSVVGVVKIGDGFSNNGDGTINVDFVNADQVKAGASQRKSITPYQQHRAVFYGLAKAAGEDMASSSNAVGTYTDDAKTAIRTMLGTVGDVQVNGTSVTSNGVANIPMADGTNPGVVKLDLSGGIRLNASGGIDVNRTTSEYYIKQGAHGYLFVPVISQHISTFYGLAKAAGDTTQSTSSNPVGTYTQEAKTAIQTMLGVTVPEAVGSCVEYITDTSVTIVGEPNTRYVCGEVTSIDITPPAVGTIDVTFTSGSTIAILTLPSTVKMPEWWTGVESGYTYELVITDGVYAGVMAWPQ